MGLKTTSFNIEEKDYELLKDKAFLMKKRVSDILRDLVSDFIKVEKTCLLYTYDAADEL